MCNQGSVSLPSTEDEPNDTFALQPMPGPEGGVGDAVMSNQLSVPHSLSANFELSPSSNSDVMSLIQSIDFGSNLDWLLNPQPDVLLSFDEADDGLGEPFHNIFGGVFPSSEPHQQGVIPSVSAPSLHQPGLQPGSPLISGLPTPNPREDCGPDDPWPMVWHARKINRLRFPPLESPGGFVHRPYFSPHTYINTSILAEMQRLVNMCSVDVEDLRLPEAAKLNHCIDLYFANFTQAMSIIHRPTFNPRASIVVTLSMAAIGILYSNFIQAQEFSYTLSEVIRKILILMEEYDRRFVRTEDHLTAQILQGFHGYCSGNQRLFELSETSRGSLVTNARRMGLFTPEKTDKILHSALSTGISHNWLDWIRKERLRRLGWGIYIYDAAVSYLHNMRPYLTIGEVNMNLPSTELEWDAESAESWLPLRSQTGITHKQTLRQLLRTLVDGSAQPLSEFRVTSHQTVVVTTLVRMIWTTKELRENPMHDLIRHETTGDLNHGLTEALDLFLESPLVDRDLRTQAQTNAMIRRLSLVHIGHLYAAGDLMNWLYPLIRNRDANGILKRRMQQWKTDRPTQVRSATFHAAQVMGLTRQFSDHSPYQVFAVFQAGVVLFFMSRLLTERCSTPEGRGASTPNLEHIQLDFLGLPSEDAAIVNARWVEHGHPVVLGLHGVPDLHSRQGRLQVLENTADMLSQMQLVWGVAKNLRRVVLGLRDLI